MAQRPPRDLDWVPDDSTGINVPSQTKQNAGWIVEKPARQFFNWMWNRLSRWTHYFSGQSQEWIVIDSTNTNEKDYDTLAAYIADSPAVGDKVLVKETQVLTAHMIIPADITLRFLGGVNITRSTLEAVSVLKFGGDVIIEGVLRLILSHTGTTAKAIEFDGDNVVGKIKVENSSTGILTTAYHVNANKTGNKINGFVKNIGGGTLTNLIVDNSTEDSNLLDIIDKTSKQIARSLGSNTFFSGFKFLFGSDADGDIYYRDAGILKRLPKGTNNDFLSLKSGIPEWETFPSFKVDRDGVNQTINNQTVTKIQFNNEQYDSNNDYDDTTNYRFTPTIAGIYSFVLNVQLGSIPSGKEIIVFIYKNGNEISRQHIWNASGSITQVHGSVSAQDEANGSTDYFEAFVFHDSGTSEDVLGSPVGATNFAGSRIS